MLHIRIIAIGKLSEPYKKLEQEFQKRLSSFVQLEVIEEKEVSHENQSIERILQKEAEKIRRHLQNSYIIILDIQGKQLRSEEFATFFEDKMQTYSSITFIIGGSLGIDASLKKNAHHLLSLSSMTFTHQMARILLQEQIYRSFTILHNKPYHKYA